MQEEGSGDGHIVKQVKHLIRILQETPDDVIAASRYVPVCDVCVHALVCPCVCVSLWVCLRLCARTRARVRVCIVSCLCLHEYVHAHTHV